MLAWWRLRSRLRLRIPNVTRVAGEVDAWIQREDLSGGVGTLAI